MNYNMYEIKEGIKLHIINNDKFKTNLISVFLTTPLNKENVTLNALIPSILRRGSMNIQTQEEISKKLEDMYGANFDCGIEKIGDNQTLKFYIESLNDNFIENSNENLLKESIETLFEIVFNPLVENESFKNEYINQEKQNLKQIIEGRKDSKARYAMDRCIEEMYKDKNYGLYKYGNVEDLEKIDAKFLYKYYKDLCNECKIDIFISGIFNFDVKNVIEENKDIKNLNERKPKFELSKIDKKEPTKENIVEESMEVVQGKLVLGLDIKIKDEKDKYKVMMYNSILGGSANSKLFQNVREKASLAYTASSSYLRYKSNILVNCGIEIKNYEKALQIIREQLEDMKNGKFDEKDIDDAKKGIVSAIKLIDDEQDTEITYFLGQELTNNNIDLETYIKYVENVSKEDIVEIAKNTSINTIYFLKD